MAFQWNKNSSLSERDILILYQLHEKVTLSIKQLHVLCFSKVKIFSAYKVLARLKTSGFVQSNTYEMGNAGRIADVYLITKKGFEILKQNLPKLLGNQDFRNKHAPQLRSAIQHRLFIIDYWISLELTLARSKEYSLKLFFPEYKKLPNGKPITLRVVQANGEPVQVRNDALFILTNNRLRKQYLFGLEVDRGTMPIRADESANSIMHEKLAARSSIEDKLLKINSVFGCGNQAFINLGGELSKFHGMRVVFATSGAKHVLNILNYLQANQINGEPSVFLFTHENEWRTNGGLDAKYALVSTSGITTRTLRDFLSF